MTSTQTFSIEGKDSEVVRLIVSLDLTAVSTVNVVVSGVTTFASNSSGRAFSAAPVVIGTNVPLQGKAWASAMVTATSISIYFRGVSDNALTDGTVAVTATVEGRLA